QEKMVTTTDMRYRTASAVMRMLGGKPAQDNDSSEPEDVLATRAFADEVFNDDNGIYHSVMVQGVLGLSERPRSEEHTSELQSRENLVCRLLLEKKKINHDK